jgi:hypothetical protein
MGVAAATWSLAACVAPAGAQSIVPPKRLGISSGFGCSGGILPRRLAELGWIEGRTLTIDCISTVSPDPDQLTLLATELVARRPDVLVTGPRTYVRALKQATATISIVMVSTPNPVEAGLVTNLGLTLAVDYTSLHKSALETVQ